MLLDTSGILASLFPQETPHRNALALLENRVPKLLHSYILAECVALATARRYSRSRMIVLLQTLLRNPNIQMIWVDETLNGEALALLEDRSDKAYSLCDAVSFVLMKQKGITEALTTDHHFEQEGFRKLLEP